MPNLEAATRIYWRISQAYNGHGGEKIGPFDEQVVPFTTTVVDALNNTQRLLEQLNPERPLAKAIHKLREEIVYINANDPKEEEASNG